MNATEVRAALLSTRLHADAVEQPLIPARGPGVMTLEDALKTLIKDADGARRTPSLTRHRLAAALADALDPGRTTNAAEIRPFRTLLDPDHQTTISDEIEVKRQDEDLADDERAEERWASVRPLLDKLADGHLGEELDPDLYAAVERGRQAAADRAAGNRGSAVRESDPWWKTKLVIEPGGATTVTSYVDVGTTVDIRNVIPLCDPKQWVANSLFWLPESEVLESKNYRDGKGWHGEFLEVVSAITIYRAVLHIDYRYDDNSCLLTYKLVESPDAITCDEGYAFVARMANGRVRTHLVKRVDFANGPFGGPNAMDECLPSYIGSWLRVQQDLWAAKAAEKAPQRLQDPVSVNGD